MSAGSVPSPSFCAAAWLDRLVDERGFIKVCCVAEGAGNFVTDESGQRMNVTQDLSENDILNSPRLRELRRTMLAGEWDPMCERCRFAEAAGGGSSRIGRNHHLQARIAETLAATAPDGTIADPKVRHLDMRLGNHCNLTCRMCTPGSSRLWTLSWNRVQPERYRLSPERIATFRSIDWPDDPAVWSRFRRMLPSIEWLHFAGGEPMMIPAMIDALRMAVAEGCADRIHLSYHTNITLLPDAVRELWPRFKRVSLSCSIDGYGALNEYIRRPSKWSDIDRHLHALDRHFREWNLFEVYIGTTVQSYNVLDLDRLYDYLRSEFEHVRPLPALSVLSWPAYLSTQVLPRAAKERAREKLLVEKQRVEYQGRPELSWLLATIDPVIAWMDAADLSSQWPDFVQFTRESEREFGDSLDRTGAELARICEAGVS